MTINIGGIDAAIVIVYMLAVLGFGLWIGRGSQTAARYFLGDRSLPWGALLLSMVATETSTVTFLSIPGLAAAAGAADRMNFIAFGGDGGTYDIGLQSLSGAMERGHNFLYVCYDNEAYMNTGIQRSSATPLGAHTSTAPAGKVKQGKEQNRKDLTKIMVAHNIPYVAQTTPFHWKDLAMKVEKALACEIGRAVQQECRDR